MPAETARADERAFFLRSFKSNHKATNSMVTTNMEAEMSSGRSLGKEAIDRIGKLRKQSTAAGLDAVIILSAENLFYFTGSNFSLFQGRIALLLTKDQTKLIYPAYWGLGRRLENFPIDAQSYESLCENPLNNMITLISEELTVAKKVGLEVNKVTAHFAFSLQKMLPTTRFVNITDDVMSLRTIKSEIEVNLIKKAANLCDLGMSTFADNLREGVTEKQIALEVEGVLRERGADGFGFPIMIASGLNASDPCWIASDRKIRRGDMVFCDVGPIYKGYCGDCTRTIFVGNALQKSRKMFKSVLDAQMLLRESARAGMTAGELDKIARDSISKDGFGQHFLHPAGHGVGLRYFEDPVIAPGNQMSIKKGMVFTLEIGIYIPGIGGVRLEDTVYMSSKKLMPLTKSPLAFNLSSSGGGVPV